MKTGYRKSLISSLIAILFCAVGVSASQLIWDPLGNNGGAGSGNWDIATTNWWNGSADVVWSQNSGTSPLNGAVFNGPDAAAGTYNVTNDQEEVAITNMLQVNNNGYTFWGPYAIYVGTNDTLAVAPDKTVTFNCPMAGSATSPIWSLGSGAIMNVGGNMTTGQQLRMVGAPGSMFNLTGINTPGIVWVLGQVTITNGSMVPTSSFYIGYVATVNATSYTSGDLTVGGSASATFNGNIFIIARSGGAGVLTVTNDASVTIGSSAATRNLAINYDSSANSSATVNVYGGTLTVGSSAETGNVIDFFDTGNGGTGATAVLNQTGGVINAVNGIVFGPASGTLTGGSAALTNAGGALYVGADGIRLNQSYPASIVIWLSGGTVGASANWSSSMPMTLASDNSNTTFQCADAGGNFWNISLSGALTGTGGFYQTGGGTLALSGPNLLSAPSVVSNGTLAIITGNTMTYGPITLDGSTGSPTLSSRVSNRGQSWSMGTLSFTNGQPTADFQYGSLTPSTTEAAIQVNGDVSFGVAPVVTLEGTALAGGTYPLIQYTGTVSGTVPTALSLPGYASGYITNIAGAHTIALVITSSTFSPAFTWAVGNGIWDTTTYNWKQFGTPTNYTDGDAVLFDDTASGASPITVMLNTVVTPQSVTANNTAKQYIITGTGSIAGAESLELLGGGTVTLTETNIYSGGTIVNAGQLNINNGGTSTSSAIGTGALTLNNGAAIDNTSGSNITMQAANTENWNGDFTYVGAANSFNTGTGIVYMNANVSLTVGSNDFIVGDTIADSGGNFQLTKTGNGALTLTSPNAFSGGLTLFSGLLNIGDPNAFGSGVATIEGGAIDNISGALLALNTVSYVWSGSFSFLGTTNLDLGTGTIVDSSGPVTVNVVTNTFYSEGNISSGNNVITKTGNGVWVMAGGATSANELQLVVNSGEVDFDRSGQAIGVGNNGLTVQSNGLVVDFNGFQIHSDTPSTPVPVSLAGGVMDLNGKNENIDKLSVSDGGTLRNGAGGTSTLNLISGYTAQLSGTNCQFDVPLATGVLNFEGPIGGAGTLVKTGLGTLMLSSNNSYTGNTLINAGTLALTGVGSISNQADIELAANSALDLTTSSYLNTNDNPTLTLLPGQTLSGSGVVTGLVESVSGSTVAPGTPSTTGVLTITGFDDTNILDGVTIMKLNKGGLANDELSVTGSLVYGGALVLTNLSGSLAAGDTFTLFNAPGGYSGAFASVGPRPNYPAFGLSWNTNNLALNGSISVVAATVPPSPRITGVSLSGTTLLIQGSNGIPNESFVLLESTNVAMPLPGWVPVLTNTFDGSGDFSLSVATTNSPQEFFTLQMQ
ncbi:MAG TPA: autotransporter-associated beta strand repeat-containing protein [Verrucomicrobiae bacterium]|jgi:autotransporter-associated beta strand protein|nr:autotransporter-associated beta strand repeat-containing protein [Verrucomicrobiae bacterium]